ncbi:MAG: hypothetical protein GW778_05220 [Alphaproteobacteria bacterium]|nr:hypothetical protein [Alphaproteobacteria bacterium]
MKRKSKGWSKERRAQQAINCRRTKPERFATGPKTDKGKATSSQNAYKHGLRSADILHLRKLLRQQSAHLKFIVDANSCALPPER